MDENRHWNSEKLLLAPWHGGPISPRSRQLPLCRSNGQNRPHPNRIVVPHKPKVFYHSFLYQAGLPLIALTVTWNLFAAILARIARLVIPLQRIM
jgi:hypothetical protein